MRSHCPICVSSQRSRIEDLLLLDVDDRGLADVFGMGIRDLRQHEKRCMHQHRHEPDIDTSTPSPAPSGPRARRLSAR